jgi:hypothetical protein
MPPWLLLDPASPPAMPAEWGRLPILLLKCCCWKLPVGSVSNCHGKSSRRHTHRQSATRHIQVCMTHDHATSTADAWQPHAPARQDMHLPTYCCPTYQPLLLAQHLTHVQVPTSHPSCSSPTPLCVSPTPDVQVPTSPPSCPLPSPAVTQALGRAAPALQNPPGYSEWTGTPAPTQGSSQHPPGHPTVRSCCGGAATALGTPGAPCCWRCRRLLPGLKAPPGNLPGNGCCRRHLGARVGYSLGPALLLDHSQRALPQG